MHFNIFNIFDFLIPAELERQRQQILDEKNKQCECGHAYVYHSLVQPCECDLWECDCPMFRDSGRFVKTR